MGSVNYHNSLFCYLGLAVERPVGMLGVSSLLMAINNADRHVPDNVTMLPSSQTGEIIWKIQGVGYFWQKTRILSRS